MTTLEGVPKKNKPEPSAEELAARELVRLARAQGLSLTGPGGLLKQFTKSVLETALNEEMTEHLGHENHRAPSRWRLGQRPERDPAEDGADRGHRARRDRRAGDRDGTFEPQIVKKRQRRLTGVDEIVLSLVCEGVDHRGDVGHLPRSTGLGLQGDHLADHRQSDGGDDPVGAPAAEQC